jgi:hypothetical protein
MAVDRNETALALAQAAFDAARFGNITLFDAVQSSCSADDLARAYALSLTEKALDGSEKHRLILREYLQLKLMHEHVAAQRRMGWTINVLTGALLAFTAALAWFGYVDYSKKHESIRSPTHFVPDAPQPAPP